MTTYSPPQSTIALSSPLENWMDAARCARRRENWCIVGKFFGVFFVLSTIAAYLFAQDAVLLAIMPMLLFVPILWFLGSFLFFMFLLCNFQYGFFLLPFLLYLWAGIWSVRQRTIWSLIQTSAETNTPLADMIRAYACGCYSSPFRKRLYRFAALLEYGYTLEQAAHLDRRLVRYDILAMLRLGKNEPATLKSMEDAAQEERSYSPIQSMTILRAIYFFALIMPLVFTATFTMLHNVPQFEAIFEDFGVPMPALTTVVISSTSYAGYFVPLIPVFVLVVIFFLIMKTNVVMWRPPGFRKMFRNKDSAKMLRLLSIGLKRQVSLVEIFTAYMQVVPSTYLQLKALRIQRDILCGRDWIRALRRQNFVTSPEASLLETAQRTGNLPTLLEQLSISKERAQIRRDDLTSKLVFIPCLLGFGALIGVFVIGLFLPLLHLIVALT